MRTAASGGAAAPAHGPRESRYRVAMPGFIGPMELVLLAVVALVVFGPKKLPEMGRQLGKGMRSFKESMSGMTDSFNADSEQPAPASPVATAAEPQLARSRDDL